MYVSSTSSFWESQPTLPHNLGETEENEHAVLEALGDYKRDTGMYVENVSANYFP